MTTVFLGSIELSSKVTPSFLGTTVTEGFFFHKRIRTWWKEKEERRKNTNISLCLDNQLDNVNAIGVDKRRNKGTTSVVEISGRLGHDLSKTGHDLDRKDKASKRKRRDGVRIVIMSGRRERKD